MPLLELASLHKSFGPVAAVTDATVAFEAGKLHLVCGENGAGKSTLLKMGAGIVVPDAGRVVVSGQPLSPHTPSEALTRGVAIVTQHFALAPALTVLENIALATRGALDYDGLRKKIAVRLASLGFDLPLDTRAQDLSVGEKQRTEIVRALVRDASVLVLDEPTAVLARAEVDALYTLLHKLAAEKKAVIVVTHKMDEVRRFADRVTVMRKGEVVWTRDAPRGEGDAAALEAFVDETVRGIMGEAKPAPLDENSPKPARDRGEVVLDVRALGAIANAKVSIRAGEIVGIAGVTGNGQGELVDALALAAGDPNIVVLGRPKEHGDISFVHEDRMTMGLVLQTTARENLMLGDLATVTTKVLIDQAALDRAARARASGVGFTRDLDVLAGELSGGNQQKLVVGRALGRASARVLVLVEPTRGVDLGATREIHDRIFEAAKRGSAVLVISSDADELRALCDRILVLAKRKIVADFAPDVSDDELGVAMLSGGAA